MIKHDTGVYICNYIYIYFLSLIRYPFQLLKLSSPTYWFWLQGGQADAFGCQKPGGLTWKLWREMVWPGYLANT